MPVDAIPKALATPIRLRGTVQYGCSFLVISLGILFMFILLCIFFQVHLLKTENSISKSNRESLATKQIRNTTTFAVQGLFR